MPSEPPRPPDPQKHKASLLQIGRAVAWSFLGIRKQKHYDEDVGKITPVQAIIGGLIGAVIFVLLLIFVVSLITK